MAFLPNLVCSMAMLCLCSGVLVKPALPILDEPRPHIDEDEIPRYSYVYDVHDSLTGDFKNHHETREGGVVRGGYSFIESDGSRRVVDYVADPIHGFNAVVRKEPGVAPPTDPVAPKLPHLHPQPVHVPTILPRPYGHLAPIAAVPPVPNTVHSIQPHFKLPPLGLHPVHQYQSYEPPIPNEVYPPVVPQKFLPIGRYGYALTNAPFPNLQH